MTAHAGGPVTLVWANEAGGLTGRTHGADPLFLKWNPAGSVESLAAEAERIHWLAGRHPAPELVEHVASDDGELLVTRALPGLSAVDTIWTADPDTALRAIAEGLRVLHALPTRDCPFDWGVETRLPHASSTVPAAPVIDRLVVCHGDACAPNTLLGHDGRFLAHVDLGRVGVADRWADLAVTTMSLAWNYDAYDEAVFWDAYGVEPDVERIAYYRALWDAT